MAKSTRQPSSIQINRLKHDDTFARCHERHQDAAKTDEKAEFFAINEHFESVFNKVLASAVVKSLTIEQNHPLTLYSVLTPSPFDTHLPVERWFSLRRVAE